MMSDGKNICKSCIFIGTKDDGNVCDNKSSDNHGKMMDWEGGEGCEHWYDCHKKVDLDKLRPIYRLGGDWEAVGAVACRTDELLHVTKELRDRIEKLEENDVK